MVSVPGVVLLPTLLATGGGCLDGGEMSDESALLAAIAANPDDDTARLAYADWLDENDRAEQAEFIRVQVAIANGEHDHERGWHKNYHELPYEPNREWCPFCRERELLAHADAWRTGVLAEQENWADKRGNRDVGAPYWVAIGSWERGFPAVVSLPLALLMRPGFAARLLRQTPLKRGGIRLSDRVPEFATGIGRWYFYGNNDADVLARDRHSVPMFLRTTMPDFQIHSPYGFDTAEAAHDALAAAVYQWAWREAFGEASGSSRLPHGQPRGEG